MNELIKKVYSIPEGAKIIGVSRSLMYSLVSQHKIPHVRIGEKRILIPARALEEWLESQTVEVEK